MPVFQLTPVEAETANPLWQASRYRGGCHVTAADAAKARHYASRAFFKAAGKGPDGKVIPSPWYNPDLVECVEVAHQGLDGGEGMVTVPRDSGMLDFMTIGPSAGEVSSH